MTNLQDFSHILHSFPVPVGKCKGSPWDLPRDSTILTDYSDRTVKRIAHLKKQIDSLHDIGASILVSMET
jgi:hypothetical protein